MQTQKIVAESGGIFRQAFATGDAGLVGVLENDKLSLSFGFVFREVLELVESPTVEPSIESPALSLLPDSLKVLHNEGVCAVHNGLAYNVVAMPHKASLSAGQGFEPSLGGFCAFALQPFTQVVELPQSGFGGLEDLAIATDGKVVYSEVNAQNPVATTRRWGVDLSGKSDVKEHPAFFVLDNFKGLVSPIQIPPIVFRDVKGDIHTLPCDEGGNPHLLEREGKEIAIERDGTGFHNWLYGKFFVLLGKSKRTFEIFRSLGNGFAGKIGRKPLPQILIDKMMKLESVAYLGFKTFVDSVLDRSQEGVRHIKQFLVMLNFQLDSSDGFHYRLDGSPPLYSLRGDVQCPVQNGGESVNSPHG